MGMNAQLRARLKTGWSDEDIAKLERAWAEGETPERMATMFGYATAKTLMSAVRDLRHTGRARLPRRKPGRRVSPVSRAAEARGLSAGLMHRRILDALNEEGVGFIDNVLDDGVTTPGGAI